MAKRTRRGQKQCPSCKAWIKGTRAKACPKCGHDFTNGQAAAAPVAAEAPAKAANTVTVDQIRAVTETVKAVGGLGRLNQALALIRDVGGAKKFKELVEAMGISE
jgi:ribosomal protein L37AE/L43A